MRYTSWHRPRRLQIAFLFDGEAFASSLHMREPRGALCQYVCLRLCLSVYACVCFCVLVYSVLCLFVLCLAGHNSLSVLCWSVDNIHGIPMGAHVSRLDFPPLDCVAVASAVGVLSSGSVAGWERRAGLPRGMLLFTWAQEVQRKASWRRTNSGHSCSAHCFHGFL